jgi:hypothetical protein
MSATTSREIVWQFVACPELILTAMIRDANPANQRYD